MGRCSFGAASAAMVGVYYRWFLCVLCVVREKGCVHGLLIGSQSIKWLAAGGREESGAKWREEQWREMAGSHLQNDCMPSSCPTDWPL